MKENPRKASDRRNWIYQAVTFLRTASAALLLLVVVSQGCYSQTLPPIFSPDGRILAFPAGNGLGFFNWQTREWRKVKVPGFDEAVPIEYFMDGRRLLVNLVNGSSRKVGIFNPATNELTELQINQVAWGAALGVGDRTVLFASNTMPFSRCLFTIRTSEITCIPHLEKAAVKDGFISIQDEHLVNDNVIQFVGMASKISEVRRDVEALGASPTSDPIPFRMTFGSLPQILYSDIIRRHLMPPRGIGGMPASYVSSRNGERVIFVGRSLSEEARVRRDPRGYFRWDLFAIEDGRSRQVTNLEGYMLYPQISPNGAYAAVELYTKPFNLGAPNPRDFTSFRLTILDLQTGALTPTDWLSRIHTDPQFAPASK